MHCLGRKLAIGTCYTLLHLGATYCHLGFNWYLVPFPLGLWSHISYRFYHRLQNFHWSPCPSPFLLARHSLRGDCNPNTILLVLSNSDALLSYVPWNDTVDKAWGKWSRVLWNGAAEIVATATVGFTARLAARTNRLKEKNDNHTWNLSNCFWTG